MSASEHLDFENSSASGLREAPSLEPEPEYEYEYEYADDDDSAFGEFSEVPELGGTLSLPLGPALLAPGVDKQIERLGHPVVSRQLIANTPLVEDDVLEEHKEEFRTLKLALESATRPASWPVVVLGLGLLLLACACVVAAVWFLFPYDVPPFDGKYSKKGRDTVWSWIVGGGSCLAAVCLAVSAVIGFCAGSRATTRIARAFFYTLVAATIIVVAVLVGTYYVFYSDAEIAPSTVRTEAGIVGISGVAILLFVMIPCIVVSQVFAHDVAKFRKAEAAMASFESRHYSASRSASRSECSSNDDGAPSAPKRSQRRPSAAPPSSDDAPEPSASSLPDDVADEFEGDDDDEDDDDDDDSRRE